MVTLTSVKVTRHLSSLTQSTGTTKHWFVPGTKMDYKALKVSLDGATINSQLQKLANENPQRPAFIFLDKHMKRSVLTRQDIWDQGRKFSAFLRRLGVGKGDIVCNTLPNSPGRVISLFGSVLAGAASMTGQVLLADGEDIIKNWKDSRCKAVIVDPTQERGAITILERIKYKDENTGKIGYKGLPHLTLTIPIVLGRGDKGEHSLKTILDNEPETYVDETITADDTSLIFCTSGSTGFAKLVPHTHYSALNMGRIGAGILGLTGETVYFNSRPLGWVGGSPMMYCSVGSTRMLLDQSLGQPEDIGDFLIQILNQERCDSTLLLPPEIQFILNKLNTGSSLSKIIPNILTGGGPLSTTSMQAIGRVTDKIVVTYGSSECGFIYFNHVKDPSSYENSCVGSEPGEGMEMKLLDDKQEPCTSGETGEIYLRGPTISKGYLNEPKKTKESFLADGWFRTNDVGHVNERGQLFVYCRKANAINHRGFIHYPGWMEARINRHPDIQNSAVIGVPHPTMYEEICLCLIPELKVNLTADDAREYCKSLFLTSEKDSITPIPQYYLFFDAFPLNSNMKVDRETLKKEVIKRLSS